MNANCDLPAEDLIAYSDDELRGARLEYTEAHIRACEICRERLSEFDETGRLLDEHTPLIDDANGRMTLKSRIHELAYRRTQSRFPGIRYIRGWGHRHRKMTLAIVSPVLVLVLMLAILWPAPLQATASSLSSLLHYTEQRVTGTLHPRDDLPGEPAEGIGHESALVSPAALPLGLELVRTEVHEGQRLSHQYEDGESLTILLDQTPSEVATDSISMETAQIVRVKDTDVLWLRGPRHETVSALLWERHEVVFSVMILEAPEGPEAGLELEDALTVVESVMEQQESAERGEN